MSMAPADRVAVANVGAPVLTNLQRMVEGSNGMMPVGGLAPPVPMPQPAPQPMQQPMPQPAPQPMQQPMPQPAPQPMQQPMPQPVPQPMQQPMPQPVPQPMQQPMPQPMVPQQVMQQPSAPSQPPMAHATAIAAAQAHPAQIYHEVPYEPPMTAEEALATAEREGLIMPRSNSQTGYRGVTHVTGKKARPFQAWVCREGKLERLGRFATPEEAALCRARTPEGKKAAARSGARGGKTGPVPMTVEEAEAQAEAAEAQAEAEGLTLQRSENQTGFVGVYVNTSNKVKPFEARVRQGGQRVFLGHFATAEEAALEVARVAADQPEGKKPRKPHKKRKAPDEQPPVVQAEIIPTAEDPEYQP
eukprot:Transcript_1762.p2 GENE.Transcript_1762~~Transcript_1762.p2  ORF type:complete len:407 (-),score=124.86 Transcript_1762:316-1392(-)